MAKSRAPRRLLWLIANHENGRIDVFTLRPDDDREVLPVFSFKEEAETFLRLGETETAWRARETTAGELISLLYGPCARVNRVALDPVPVVDGEMGFDLAGWGRRDFLQNFVSAPLVRNQDSRAEVTIVTGLLKSPDGRGTPSREPGEQRVRTENGAATWRKPERIRDGLLNENGEAAIPDYVTRDPGSLQEEAGEAFARDHE
ncbi:MAG: hypothetical protein AVDCRST_MAG80-402 [uncultured Rubrobacteraceae bacterium]|uniref:SseB protein N-terminal domain-containing protein n=1 Tax=uncultured Rubrobacteraceae bacterium TaxID=349277 RepID=A0A6J4PXD0_9ACTN|nr:MAG: hypothetical protein AVDCRST_MAG80-402 [uncultured Rubrobacteraceae bacterium]